jgi:hypothetical protein
MRKSQISLSKIFKGKINPQNYPFKISILTIVRK